MARWSLKMPIRAIYSTEEHSGCVLTVVVAVNGKKAQFELNEISFGAIYDCLDTIKHG